MKMIESIIQTLFGRLFFLHIGKNQVNRKYYHKLTMILVLILAFSPGCKKKSAQGDANLIAYNTAVVNLNQSFENFLVNEQVYESTDYTTLNHNQSKAIVDAYTQAGDQFTSDMYAVLSYKKSTGSTTKTLKDGPPCSTYDLVPGLTGGVQVGLVKSVADLISETKGSVAAIEAQYNQGKIDENTYLSALNTLRTNNTIKGINIGFGAVMGTGASICTGIAIGASAPALVVVGVSAGVGLAVGTGITWLCNWYTGQKLKNGLSGEDYFMTTGNSRIGDPIPTTMMANNSSLTITIDGYAPIFIPSVNLPAEGHQLTLLVNPVKLDDAVTNGNTQVCFNDQVMTATTCDQVQFVTAVPDPPDPGAGESVTVIATIIPMVAGCDVTFSIVGTDGYTNSGTYQTGTDGKASFYIPGGAAGVIDHVTITTSDGKTCTVTYVFG